MMIKSEGSKKTSKPVLKGKGQEKMEMNRIKGSFRLYLLWPVWMSVLLVIMNALVYYFSVKLGLMVSGFVLVYLVAAIYMFFYRKHHLLKDLFLFGADYAQIQKQLLNELTLPYALLDDSGYVLWENKAFKTLTKGDGKRKKYLYSIIPGITEDVFPKKVQDKVTHLIFADKYYQMQIKKISLTDVVQSLYVSPSNEEITLYAVYMFDETELLSYKKQVKDEKLVVGLIYLDNYDEALDGLEEVRRSLLVALIDRKIDKYFAEYQGILKKLENDKYIVLFAMKYLADMQESKFSLLDEVKTVNIGNDMAVTISIGIGANGESYAQNYEYARSAIDLALGRGGDQVVLKDQDKVNYYGGKSHSQEKSTRVKARVKAHALKELIESKEKVVIMGHSMSDVDSIGAAVGVYRAVKTSGKRGYIVLNTVIASVKPLLERFQNNPDYEEDLFITGERAKALTNENTILIVVDVNRPSYTECPELLQMTRNIVVLDHHRQTSERIDNAVLSYVEPYASSTCEMVAEVLQYYADNVTIRPLDADAMYSGLVMDTNNFLNKTGVRTFDAAAFLRRNGADITRVRKMFRDNMEDYRARAQAVSDVEVFMKDYAISILRPDAAVENPNIVAAQAANELLNIRGIKASFVLAAYNDKIFISARSIDEVNVQIIMEKLGGGGHLSIAGAQLKDMTVEEGIQLLKGTLEKMKANDEL